MLRSFELFYNPVHAFERIRQNPVWWPDFLCVALLAISVSYFMTPLSLQLAQNMEGLTAEQLAKSETMIRNMQYLSIAFVPVTLFVQLVIIAAVYCLGLRLFSDKTAFKYLLALVVVTTMVSVVGQLVNLVIVYAHDIGEVVSQEDLNRIGFDKLFVFTPENVFLKSLLGSINVFEIARVILTILGLHIITGLSKGQAVLLGLCVWLLTLMLTAGLLAQYLQH